MISIKQKKILAFPYSKYDAIIYDIILHGEATNDDWGSKSGYSKD